VSTTTVSPPATPRGHRRSPKPHTPPRYYTPSPQISSPTPLPPSTPPPIAKKNLRRTFRITSIPPEVSKEQLQSTLLGAGVEPQQRIICSLVPHGNTQTATVTFKSGDPPQSLNCKPGSKASLELDGIGGDLSVDCDFFGITPLYCGENPTVE